MAADKPIEPPSVLPPELLESEPVIAAARREGLMLGKALLCWPETRISSRGEQSRELIERKDWVLKAEGLPEDQVTCSRADRRVNPWHGSPSPPPQNAAVLLGGTVDPSTPLQAYAERLHFHQLLKGSFCDGSIPFPTRSPPSFRRRWAQPIIVRPTPNARTNLALQEFAETLTDAGVLGGTSATISNLKPNVLLLGWGDYASAWQFPSRWDREAANRPRPCSSTSELRWTNFLAGQAAHRAVDYVWEGSDFRSSVLPEFMTEGFTVGTADRIEGAVCIVRDELVSPATSRIQPALDDARLETANCLLHALGISGTKISLPPKARRLLTSGRELNGQFTARPTPLAVKILRAMYRRPAAADRPILPQD